MTVRVFKYGLLAPTAEAEFVREQMLAAHRYRNTLVEIERGRRAAARFLMTEQPDIAPLEEDAARADAEVLEAVKSLKAKRASTRSRSETKADTERVKAAREARKATFTALRLAKRAVYDDGRIVEASKALYAQAANLGANAYEHSPLCERKSWGTRALVNEAMEAVRKSPLHVDPRFLRWQGEGQLGVQVHQKGDREHGLTCDEVYAGGSGGWVHVVRLPGRKGSRREHHRAKLRVRIGSRDRVPVIAEWPMILHRPLPEGGILKRVSVSLRRIGPREAWSVEMTFDTTLARPLPPAKGGGTVAIDIGWLSVDGGLRAATWLDDAGRAGELAFPIDQVEGLVCPDGLRSTRDKNFEAARRKLIEDLDRLTSPEWLTQATRSLPHWRSCARLAALARRWRTARFNGDAAAYERLEAWRYNDHHLWAWQESQRASSQRRRKDAYRVFAADLARRYAEVVVADTAYDEVARKPNAEEAPAIQAANHNRTLVSPGDLRLVVAHAFEARGGKVTKVSAAALSTTCPACGSSDPAQVDHIDHSFVCIGCTFSRDVDKVATMNLLRASGHEAAVAAMIESGKRVSAKLRKRSA